ncbi:MAG: hypothetical protein ACE5JP_14495 [Candidatus Bipolaricaulia bacterium]
MSEFERRRMDKLEKVVGVGRVGLPQTMEGRTYGEYGSLTTTVVKEIEMLKERLMKLEKRLETLEVQID